VAEYTSGRALKYGDHERVFEAALECGEWELAVDHAERALPLSTPEVFRADNESASYPSSVCDGARRRRVGALAARGWALANLGRSTRRSRCSRRRTTTDFRGYMGNSESERAATSPRAGDVRAARRGRSACSSSRRCTATTRRRRDTLRSGFTAARGSDEGFDAYLDEARMRLARVVDDFTLPDYEGTPHSFSQLRTVR